MPKINKIQAIVLDNYGNTTGQEILNVSTDNADTFFNNFLIIIDAEGDII